MRNRWILSYSLFLPWKRFENICQVDGNQWVCSLFLENISKLNYMISNMKKLCLMILGIFICSSSFCEKIVSVDGISYLLEGYGASVKGANLKVVEIPDTIVVDSISYKVYNIGDHAFYNDTIVESIKLPKTIEDVWDHNFIGCNNLKTIYIQSDIQIWNIESLSYNEGRDLLTHLYENCILLLSADLKGKRLLCDGFSKKIYYEGVHGLWMCVGHDIQVGDYYYYISGEENAYVSGYVGQGNPKFESDIVFLNCILNVVGIADNAFEGASIDTLIIPEFIESIGENAFKDCLGLRLIECQGENPPLCNKSFGYGLNEAKIYANCDLSVPSKSFKLYRLMDCWEKFDTKAFDFEMEVIPSTDHATFTWTPTCGATNYQLSIFSGEGKKDTICVLTFDAYGRLSEMTLRSLSYTDGYSFVVRSLKGDNAYYYEMSALDAGNNAITTRSGSFNTDQLTELTKTSLQFNDADRVYAMDGQIIIELSDDSDVEIYNLKGNSIYTSAHAQTKRIDVKSGIYVVVLNNERYKLIVK